MDLNQKKRNNCFFVAMLRLNSLEKCSLSKANLKQNLTGEVGIPRCPFGGTWNVFSSKMNGNGLKSVIYAMKKALKCLGMSKKRLNWYLNWTWISLGWGVTAYLIKIQMAM